MQKIKSFLKNQAVGLWLLAVSIFALTSSIAITRMYFVTTVDDIAWWNIAITGSMYIQINRFVGYIVNLLFNTKDA